MRKKLVAGNWKMNGSRASIRELTSAIVAGLPANLTNETAIFPSYIYIPEVSEILHNSNIAYGAQNVASEENGALTGEVSAQMLQDEGCKYVIIGHSERRTYYDESNDMIAKKFLLAVKYNLRPIICVGETLMQHHEGQTKIVIKNQLNAILSLDSSTKLLENAVFAYEPVWAIGTGVTATPEQAEEVHTYIRQLLANLDKNIAEKTPIIYGGSVKSSNAASLFAMANIDGALVGGASLNATEFLEICQCNN